MLQSTCQTWAGKTVAGAARVRTPEVAEIRRGPMVGLEQHQEQLEQDCQRLELVEEEEEEEEVEEARHLAGVRASVAEQARWAPRCLRARVLVYPPSQYLLDHRRQS